MHKKQIHQQFLDQLRSELHELTAAAKASFATATDAEHQARSKYETFSLETSYLARGQARRVEQLTEALERLQQLPLKELGPSTPIQLSALVRLTSNNGASRSLLVSPAAGGEETVADGETVTLVTSKSPIGRAILGHRVGDRVRLRTGDTAKTFTIQSVE